MQALIETCNMLRTVITDVRRHAGQIVNVVIVGDFNRHNQLWGRDNISWLRQGKANNIINLMNKIALSSLLPRGTKPWHGGEFKSTIDLVLTLEGLATNMIKCTLLTMDHGLDY